MSEETKDNPVVIEKVAQGQKFLIYAILVNIVSIALKAAIGDIAGLVAIAAIVLSFVGVFRLGSGMGYSTGFKIGLVLLMFIPLLNLIALLVLNSRATNALRASGFKVGLLGAKAPANA